MAGRKEMRSENINIFIFRQLDKYSQSAKKPES